MSSNRIKIGDKVIYKGSHHSMTEDGMYIVTGFSRDGCYVRVLTDEGYEDGFIESDFKKIITKEVLCQHTYSTKNRFYHIKGNIYTARQSAIDDNIFYINTESGEFNFRWADYDISGQTTSSFIEVIDLRKIEGEK